MRILFVVPPLAGHINPTVSVGRALRQRGHEVAWVGHPSVVRGRLEPGARLFELDEARGAAMLEQALPKSRRARGMAALKVFWEDFAIPLARVMVDEVDAAVEQFSPDVVVVDHQAIAGALVARRRGLRWASSATTSASVGDSLDAFPKVKQWQQEQVLGLQREFGLTPLVDADVSPHLVLVFSTPALVGDVRVFPRQSVFVGPAFSTRPVSIDFPWDDLREGVPRVLVSLGTVNAQRGGRFFGAAVEALSGMDVQGVLVAPESVVPEVPDNVIRRDRVPQVELLKHVDAVVTHAGHNTVCESLAHGLPLVVAPITDDQPVVAGQVVAAGAGVRVRYGRVGAVALREAIEEVLREDEYRAAAKRVGDSFRAAGGAEAAADAVERLGQQSDTPTPAGAAGPPGR